MTCSVCTHVWCVCGAYFMCNRCVVTAVHAVCVCSRRMCVPLSFRCATAEEDHVRCATQTRPYSPLTNRSLRVPHAGHSTTGELVMVLYWLWLKCVKWST